MGEGRRRRTGQDPEERRERLRKVERVRMDGSGDED